jgi:O-antigen ligase
VTDDRSRGTRTAEASAGTTEARPPRAVGVAWALLAVNVLGFYEKPGLVLPLPRPVAQMVTMGALVIAFALALLANRRVRVRPSAYLLLLSLLALVSIASSLRLESGVGALFRCFRLTLFIATLWLLSAWWRGDLRFVRYHVRTVSAVLLSILCGIVLAPGAAFTPVDGRLTGAIWPIPAPQVGLYAAIVIGLSVTLWLVRSIDGRAAAVVAVPAFGILLLSHTRTALIGLIVALTLSGMSQLFSNGRVRRSFATAFAFGIVVAAVFGQVVQTWLARGQDADQLASLTGRQRVWDALLAQERTLQEHVLGVGLTDKSFNGLAIDNGWLSIYHEQGLAGVAIVATILAVLLFTVALRPPTPERACAMFLIIYCVVASYTEVGLGDASPYLLCLAVAASLLARAGSGDQVRPART